MDKLQTNPGLFPAGDLRVCYHSGAAGRFGRELTRKRDRKKKEKSCLLAPVSPLRGEEGEQNAHTHKAGRLVCSGNQAERMCLKPHMVLTITETAVFSLCHSSHAGAIRFLFSACKVGGKTNERARSGSPSFFTSSTWLYATSDGNRSRELFPSAE